MLMYGRKWGVAEESCKDFFFFLQVQERLKRSCQTDALTLVLQTTLLQEESVFRTAWGREKYVLQSSRVTNLLKKKLKKRRVVLIGLSQAWSCRGTLSNSNFPEGQCRWWMDGSMKDQWILKLLLTYWPLRPLFSLSSLEKLLWTPVRVSWQEQHLLSWLSHMLVRKLSPACLWATCCLLSFAGVILRVASFLLLPFFLFLLHRACAIRYSEPCFSETGSSACSCLTNSRSPLDRVAWRPIMHLEMGDIFLTTNQAKKK